MLLYLVYIFCKLSLKKTQQPKLTTVPSFFFNMVKIVEFHALLQVCVVCFTWDCEPGQHGELTCVTNIVSMKALFFGIIENLYC